MTYDLVDESLVHFNVGEGRWWTPNYHARSNRLLEVTNMNVVLHYNVGSSLMDPTCLKILNVALDKGNIRSVVTKLLCVVVNILPGHF